MTMPPDSLRRRGGFTRYLKLPAHITQFERTYLQRMNRLALWFLAAHVPMLMAVAWLANTGVLRAAVFSTFLVLGPAIALRTFDNPRHVTKVYAVAGMGLTGLLVHFGQGPMQIEMHFYFFVWLALLVVFADPLVILVAAGTIVVHHLLLYLLLPASIFNYDASLWTVVVHALFVLVESAAGCFVARTFFDNVLGLDQKVERRTRALEARSNELRLMLDTVDQGFLTLDPQGVVQSERSRILDTWLPPCPPAARAWDYLGLADRKVGQRFRLGWDAIEDDVLPLELLLDQLPKRLQAGEVTLDLSYHPLLVEGRLRQIVLVLSDVSVHMAQQRVEAENADLLAVCERIAHDRSGFREYLDEADQLVRDLRAGADGERRAQLVHTLKGNSALFGLGVIARLCHEYEDAVAAGTSVAEIARAELLSRWDQFRKKLTLLFGTREADTFEVTEADYIALHRALLGGGRREEILPALERIRLEPVQARLTRLGEQAQQVALALGKGALAVHVDAGDLRLERMGWGPLWSALVHVVHNAVDHGIEPRSERERLGKTIPATLSLHAERRGRDIVLTLADDGAGLDLEALRRRALELDLPAITEADLLDAMFATGLSTKAEATAISGRGVGLGAVRALVRRMGGTMSVHSADNAGTRFVLVIPEDSSRRHSSRVPARLSDARALS